MKQQNKENVKSVVTKGILQTNNKNPSKNNRISWGEIKIKEYETNVFPADNRTIEELDSLNSKLNENYSEEEKISKKKENFDCKSEIIKDISNKNKSVNFSEENKQYYNANKNNDNSSKNHNEIKNENVKQGISNRVRNQKNNDGEIDNSMNIFNNDNPYSRFNNNFENFATNNQKLPNLEFKTKKLYENDQFLNENTLKQKQQEKEILFNKLNEMNADKINQKSNNLYLLKNANEVNISTKNITKIQTNSKLDLNILLDNQNNNFNYNRINENKIFSHHKESEKIADFSNIAFDLYNEKDFDDKIFEISDFIPGRISEISNNIEKMNLEGNQIEANIKRDFNNENFKEDKNIKNNNNKIPNKNRLTIELIAKDIGLINDDIEYTGLNNNDFKNNDYVRKINNNSKSNPFLAHINEYNNEFAQKFIEKESNIVKEEPKKVETNNAFINKINNNPYFNRITQLGPLYKYDVKDSSDDISFSIDNNYKTIKNQKKEEINFDKMNKYPNPTNSNLILHNNNPNINKALSNNPQTTGNFEDNLNNNNKNINNLNSVIELNPNKKECLPIDLDKYINNHVPILKNPFNYPIKETNTMNTNQMNVSNPNNLFEPQNKDKNKKTALIIPNKFFETNNKNFTKEDSNDAQNNNNNMNDFPREVNNKIAYEKKHLPKKITMGINDILNFNNYVNSSENEESNRNSEKSTNKFAKKRKSIKRDTLNFLKHKDFTQISFSSDEEKSYPNEKPIQNNNSKNKPINLLIVNENLNKQENNPHDKMDICDAMKQSPKNKYDLNNKKPPNCEEIEENFAMNEAEEILKNLEMKDYNNHNKNMSLFDQNKISNFNSKNILNYNNSNNPFLSAVKNKNTDLKENEDKKIDNNLNTPITPYKKDDYLQATPGKYYISNNSSKIKEKEFSKFTGYMPDYNLPSKKILEIQQEIKENKGNMKAIINNTNNDIIITNNNQRLKSNNLLNIKENNKQDLLNNRVTINPFINLKLEDNEESEIFSFDENKNNLINKKNQKHIQIEKDLNQIHKIENTIPVIQNNLIIEKTEPQEANNNIKTNIIKAEINKNENDNFNKNCDEENKDIENISFSQFANVNICNFNVPEELEKEDVNIAAISKKIRERNNKLFEYLKEIFKSRFTKMKNAGKAFKEKEQHLNSLRDHIEMYKKEIITFEKEMQIIESNKKFFENFDKYYKFLSRNLLNTKILGIEFNTLKLIFANTINISFVFEELNHKMLFGFNVQSLNNLFWDNNNNYSTGKLVFQAIKLNEVQRKSLKKTKIMLKDFNFFFISNFMDELKFKDKLIEDPEVNKVFRRMITYAINNIFTNKNKQFYAMNIFEFIEGYKIFIDAAINIVYLINQFYLWDSIFNIVSLNFDEAKALLIMIFSINCAGYNLILTFTCDIFDAFFGYDFIHYEIVRDYISENELAIERNRIDKICENIKSFLESKHKLFNPYFFFNFIQNVKKKIIENNFITSKK